MTSNRDITTVLKTLDPASRPAEAGNPRARADLQRILDADPSTEHPRQLQPSVPGRKSRPSRTTRNVRRVVLAGGVLAVTAGMVALPAVRGGDAAFASWTRVPQGLSASERADAASSCRDRKENGAGAGYVDQLEHAQLAIAEQRGVWTTVILAGARGFAALCVTDDSSHTFGFGTDMIGSVGTLWNYIPPGPRDLIPTDLGSGTMSAGDISLAAGIAGSDIIRVVYPSRTHGDVNATVSGGHFALWFPGDELNDASSSNPVQVEVTYRDGSTGTSRLSL